MTDWIFQGNGKQLDLDAAIAVSPLRSWRTPADIAAALWERAEARLDPI